jgi:type IV pilus assembly protein PilX
MMTLHRDRPGTGTGPHVRADALQREAVCRPGQAGFSLMAVLVMMVVLATLALAGLNTSLLQERMAGNARDLQLATQAAEAALRDAEADIVANLSADSAFVTGCTAGLCVPASMTSTGAVSTQRWELIDWAAGANQSRAYGSQTGATALPGVTSAPRYIVELLPELPPVAGQSASLASSGQAAQAFRITARGTGLRSTTVVVLQSTYVKQ